MFKSQYILNLKWKIEIEIEFKSPLEFYLWIKVVK